MAVRSFFLAALAAAVAGCAQQETPSGCSPPECRADCAPRSGSCIDGRCMCGPVDGGADADADADGDADGPDVVREDAVADEAGIEDRGPEDVPAEEGGPADIGDPCTVDDLVEQELCGEGMKCVFTELVGTSPDPFCDVAGARPINLPCGGASISDTCQAGLLCLNDGSSSRCKRLCRTDADCSVLGTRAGCLIQLNFSGTVVDGIEACTMDCDVLAGTGCATGQACRPQFEDTGGGVYHAYSDCTGAGTGTQGADCTAHASADCAVRYGCFIVGGLNQCLYLCNMSLMGGDCPAGAGTCNNINDPAGRIGACL
jgi:hypothetical protein